MDNNVVAAVAGELGSCDTLHRAGCGCHVQVVQSGVVVRLRKYPPNSRLDLLHHNGPSARRAAGLLALLSVISEDVARN